MAKISPPQTVITFNANKLTFQSKDIDWKNGGGTPKPRMQLYAIYETVFRSKGIHRLKGKGQKKISIQIANKRGWVGYTNIIKKIDF